MSKLYTFLYEKVLAKILFVRSESTQWASQLLENIYDSCIIIYNNLDMIVKLVLSTGAIMEARYISEYSDHSAMSKIIPTVNVYMQGSIHFAIKNHIPRLTQMVL